MQLHDSQGGSVVAIRQVELDEIRRHGIVRLAGIVREDLDPYDAVRITGLVEKPSLGAAPSRFGVFGRYLLEPCIWEAIAQTRADAGGEIQLTDALHSLCQNNLLSGLCFAGQHFDAGDPLGYLKANVEFALREPSLSQPLKEFLSRRTA
jgi:UTP--glucose-1-phosphate uridylyltransferase